MGKLKAELSRQASRFGSAAALAAGSGVVLLPGASAATVTVDIGAVHDQSWDLTEGIAAVGAVGLALAGLFLVVKVVKAVFASIV